MTRCAPLILVLALGCQSGASEIALTVYPDGTGSFHHTGVFPVEVKTGAQADPDRILSNATRIERVEATLRVLHARFDSVDRLEVGDLRFSYKPGEKQGTLRVTIPATQKAVWYRSLGFSRTHVELFEKAGALEATRRKDDVPAYDRRLYVALRIVLPGKIESQRLVEPTTPPDWSMKTEPEGIGLGGNDPDNCAVLEIPVTDVLRDRYQQTVWEIVHGPMLDRFRDAWEADQGRILRLPDAPANIEVVAFSPDDRFLAAGIEDGSILIWDVSTRKQVMKIAAHARKVVALAWSPDGSILASSAEVSPEIRLWKAATGETAGDDLDLHEADLLRFEGGGSGILVWTRWRGLERLDRKSGASKKIADAGDACALTGNRAAIVRGDSIVTLDLSTGDVLHSLRVERTRFCAAAISPDGKMLAVGDGDGVVRILDGDGRKELQKSQQQKSRVEAIAFLPDSKRLLITRNMDTTLWDPSSGKIERGFTRWGEAGRTMVPDHQGKWIAGLGGRSVRLWKIVR